jgi:Short C-terminal domain
MMRRRGPGLARTVARTAVVAGTASAVSGRVHRNQQQKWANQEQQAAQQQAAAPQQAPQYVEAAPADDYTAELEKLAQLKNQGILTEEEFQAKKRQILGI